MSADRVDVMRELRRETRAMAGKEYRRPTCRHCGGNAHACETIAGTCERQQYRRSGDYACSKCGDDDPCDERTMFPTGQWLCDPCAVDEIELESIRVEAGAKRASRR